MKRLAFLSLLLLSSCAGSGEGGAWTPRDTTATVDALNSVGRAYSDYRNGYPQHPAVVAPVAPPVY